MIIQLSSDEVKEMLKDLDIRWGDRYRVQKYIEGLRDGTNKASKETCDIEEREFEDNAPHTSIVYDDAADEP